MFDETEYKIDSSSSTFNFRELWFYKELFYFFTWRDIKIKYKQTVLGFVWAILQPLLMMVIFTFFFGKTLNIPSQNLPYPIYVFSGLLLWNCFASGMTSSAQSMVTNAPIIKKIYFPRIIIPVSSILVSVFDYFMAFTLFIILLVYYGIAPSTSAFIFWPISILLIVISTLGIGSLIGALNVKYRDFRYVIPFLVQMLFFMSPVIYPMSLVENEYLKMAMSLSPVFCAIECFRFPLTGEISELKFLLMSLGFNFTLLFVGINYFKKTEAYFADFA